MIWFILIFLVCLIYGWLIIDYYLASYEEAGKDIKFWRFFLFTVILVVFSPVQILNSIVQHFLDLILPPIFLPPKDEEE